MQFSSCAFLSDGWCNSLQRNCPGLVACRAITPKLALAGQLVSYQKTFTTVSSQRTKTTLSRIDGHASLEPVIRVLRGRSNKPVIVRDPNSVRSIARFPRMSPTWRIAVGVFWTEV